MNLTNYQQAFFDAVDSLGGIPDEAVIAFIHSDDHDVFYDGEYGEYYSLLADYASIFASAIQWAKNSKAALEPN